MKKLTIPLALAGAAIAVCQIGAAAAIVDANGLNLSWKESGLTAGTYTYEVRARAQVTYGCFNRGGKNPAAANKRATFTTDVARQVKLVVTSQAAAGRARLPIPAVGNNLSCPNGQTAMVSSVTYGSVMLKNTVTDAAHTFPGRYSKTFRPLK